MPKVSEGRLRTLRAAKKRRRAEELWGERDTSWHRLARCFVCRKTFVCNNYPDHRVRLTRIRGKIVCPWCKQHLEIDYIVWLMSRDSSKKGLKHIGRKNGGYAGPS